MHLRVGIVGLPNVGKSTLFQIITKKEVDCSNYPFCTIEPNVGVVEVFDERVDKMAELAKSAKKKYATVEFVDIAGLVKGASKGEGLGNKFLANIREVNAVVYVLRAFQDESVSSSQKGIDVLRDKEILDIEMALKDLATIEKRIEGIQKEIRAGDKDAKISAQVFEKAKNCLSQEKILSDINWTERERKLLNECQFLTIKPRIYLLNGKDGEAGEEALNVFKKNNWHFIEVDILSEFCLPEQSKIDELIKQTYKLLDLLTFFTTGADETRAWTIKKGSSAPQAGGAIHSDFEDNFIKALVIDWKTLIDKRGFARARESGLVRMEGKEYIVKDGDVIEIKFGA